MLALLAPLVVLSVRASPLFAFQQAGTVTVTATETLTVSQCSGTPVSAPFSLPSGVAPAIAAIQVAPVASGTVSSLVAPIASAASSIISSAESAGASAAFGAQSVASSAVSDAVSVASSVAAPVVPAASRIVANIPSASASASAAVGAGTSLDVARAFTPLSQVSGDVQQAVSSLSTLRNLFIAASNALASVAAELVPQTRSLISQTTPEIDAVSSRVQSVTTALNANGVVLSNSANGAVVYTAMNTLTNDLTPLSNQLTQTVVNTEHSGADLAALKTAVQTLLQRLSTLYAMVKQNSGTPAQSQLIQTGWNTLQAEMGRCLLKM
ncbi:hypothetical protein MKEN_00853400 [Mycena kentingensis (nom. inval.)]|nr:hypothetical protein MKEN_00853400 [Mycena kentingensis (nom. inval.)]